MKTTHSKTGRKFSIENLLPVFCLSIVDASAQGSPTADLDHAIGQAGGLRTGMLLGDPEHGIVAINSGSAPLNTVVSVQALVTELASGFSA
ncbi:hypothetical protein [Levilactobacillus spicheri]|uniref:Uncharacterized protein n=1 Tax=Levilactobacillus spicheri TaxID=216463 RepID=A0A0F3RU06_9LACO|nr:hypothetical protein [Levilactobacillus spicheri]KJW13370.1 hypothetical protein VC81_02585 [Levilactobacillus spicheri]